MKVFILRNIYETMRFRRGGVTHAATVYSEHSDYVYPLCSGDSIWRGDAKAADGPVACARCRKMLAQARASVAALLGEEE